MCLYCLIEFHLILLYYSWLHLSKYSRCFSNIDKKLWEMIEAVLELYEVINRNSTKDLLSIKSARTSSTYSWLIHIVHSFRFSAALHTQFAPANVAQTANGSPKKAAQKTKRNAAAAQAKANQLPKSKNKNKAKQTKARHRHRIKLRHSRRSGHSAIAGHDCQIK